MTHFLLEILRDGDVDQYFVVGNEQFKSLPLTKDMTLLSYSGFVQGDEV